MQEELCRQIAAGSVYLSELRPLIGSPLPYTIRGHV